MRFGSTWGSGFGSPNNHLAATKITNEGASLRVEWQPLDGFGDSYWGIYSNSVLSATVFAPEGVKSSYYIPAKLGTQSVTIIRNGTVNPYDLSRVVRSLEAPSVDQATIAWRWGVDLITPAITSGGYEDVQLSNWAFTGLAWTDLEKEDQDTRRKLVVDLTVDGANATVDLYNGTRLIGTGTAAWPGTITLTSSYFTAGSVDVCDTPTSDQDMVLRFRRPSYLNVLRDQANPPTTIVDQVVFSSLDQTWTDPGSLTTGTYYYALQPVSDTGTTGTQSASLEINVVTPPIAPSNLAYSSGDAPNTVVTFTVNDPGPNITHRAYIKGIGEAPVDLNTPAATGTSPLTLPAITGYPGTITVLVRAYDTITQIEEQNSASIDIEYDEFGAKVAARPNQVQFSATRVNSGTRLQVDCTYDPSGEAGTAESVQLFIREPEQPEYDYQNPVAETFFTPDGEPQDLTLTYTHGGTGWLYFVIKASTDVGVLSLNPSDENMIYLSDGLGSAPLNTSIRLSRG